MHNEAAKKKILQKKGKHCDALHFKDASRSALVDKAAFIVQSFNTGVT